MDTVCFKARWTMNVEKTPRSPVRITIVNEPYPLPGSGLQCGRISTEPGSEAELGVYRRVRDNSMWQLTTFNLGVGAPPESNISDVSFKLPASGKLLRKGDVLEKLPEA